MKLSRGTQERNLIVMVVVPPSGAVHYTLAWEQHRDCRAIAPLAQELLRVIEIPYFVGRPRCISK